MRMRVQLSQIECLLEEQLPRSLLSTVMVRRQGGFGR